MERHLERHDIIGFEWASGDGMRIHTVRESTHSLDRIFVKHMSNASVDGIAENDPGVAKRYFIQRGHVDAIGLIV